MCTCTCLFEKYPVTRDQIEQFEIFIKKRKNLFIMMKYASQHSAVQPAPCNGYNKKKKKKKKKKRLALCVCVCMYV